MRILITGANRGLGYQILKQIAERKSHNFDLHFTTRSKEEGEKLVNDFSQKFPSSKFRNFQLDISDDKQQEQFIELLNKENITYDVIVNNAGVYIRPIDDPVNAAKTIQVNFISTIDFTNRILGRLVDNGKVVFLSSLLGKLSFHTGKAVSALSNPKNTFEDLKTLAKDFVEELRNKTAESGFHRDPYYVSKALLNAYIRFIAPSTLKNQQSFYAVHPGWCQTDMGGKEAPSTAEQGAVSTQKVIFDLPFSNDPKFNCQFYDEHGSLFDW